MRIRPCCADDLEGLEWDGEYAHDRAAIRDTFARMLAQDMVMLVAEDCALLVGQVWLDLARVPDATYLWALRVREPWRGRGIASRLVTAVEHASRARGFTAIDLDLAAPSSAVRAFYERRGYVAVDSDPIRLRKRLA